MFDAKWDMDGSDKPSTYRMAFCNPPGGDMRFSIHWDGDAIDTPGDRDFAQFRLKVPRLSRGMTLQLWREDSHYPQEAAMSGSIPGVDNELHFDVRLSELRALAAGKPALTLVAMDRHYKIVARARFDTALLAAAVEMPGEQREAARRLSSDYAHRCEAVDKGDIVIT